jgi:hypothetical protein
MISGNEKPKSQRVVNVVDRLVAGGGKEIENNSNLSLFGQCSPTSAVTSAKPNDKNCVVCSPGGLTTTTLNLSSIGPLCTNIGCIGATAGNSSKNLNSNDRMSRSASPALGAGGENPRLSSNNNWRIFPFFLRKEFCFMSF